MEGRRDGRRHRGRRSDGGAMKRSNKRKDPHPSREEEGVMSGGGKMERIRGGGTRRKEKR